MHRNDIQNHQIKKMIYLNPKSTLYLKTIGKYNYLLEF